MKNHVKKMSKKQMVNDNNNNNVQIKRCTSKTKNTKVTNNRFLCFASVYKA